MHLEWDLPNPLQDNYHLRGTLRGMRRSMGDTTHPKLPITPPLLRSILAHLDMSSPLDANVWGVCLLLFYGLLRKASVLPNTGNKNLDMEKILCRDDVIFHSWGMMVSIRTTKTIQFKERSLSIPFPRHQNSDLCPVQAVVHAFSNVPQPSARSPAFVLPGHPKPSPLTGPMFVNRIRHCLRIANVDSSKFGGHSLRRGGASFLYEAGVPTETIRALGDWRSSAYLKYITISSNTLFTAIKTMQNHL